MEYFKIIWIAFAVTYLWAFPTTVFAKWGETKFGSYGKFINHIILFYFTLIVITKIVLFLPNIL